MTDTREVAERRWWHDLDPADWLFDGHPIKSDWMDAWRKLDWSKAWLDMGPSPAGNIGPYFHVPDDDDDCVHRLYPKLLLKPRSQAILEGIMTLARSTALRAAEAGAIEKAAKVAEQHTPAGVCRDDLYRWSKTADAIAAAIRALADTEGR